MKTSTQRCVSLFFVLSAAKLVLLGLRALDGAPLTLWRALAVLREEALLCSILLLCDALIGRGLEGSRVERGAQRILWALYGAIVVYAVANVPVARVLGSPLTASMIGATGGALLDSLLAYATLGNVVAVLGLLALGAWLPRALSRISPRSLALAGGAGALLGALGWLGAYRADTLGLHRDPLFTLARTELQRTRLGAARSLDPAALVVPQGEALDLSHLSSAARGRHVVWIILESTGARYLAIHGAKDDPMPNLTRLAQKGIVFEHAYAAYPESIKGLYASLCSFAPAPHTSAEAYAASRLPCVSIAQVAKDSGYSTALYHSGRFLYLGMDHVVRERGFDRLVDAKDIRGKYYSSFGTDDMSTARAVLRRFDERGPGEKLLVAYMPISGHHPYETPGEGPRPFGEESDLARYKSDLFRGDLALGALVLGLKERGLYDDTLFVIHGDHGEAFLQHEGNVAHSLFPYEENVHVPLVVVAPGLLTRSIRAPQLVSLMDVAPTILDLLGAERPASWQGRSALEGRPRVVRFFTDHTVEMLALRNGRWKLILDMDSGRARLFDLLLDPDERAEVSSAHPERTLLYSSDLKAWTARQRWIVDGKRLEPVP